MHQSRELFQRSWTVRENEKDGLTLPLLRLHEWYAKEVLAAHTPQIVLWEKLPQLSTTVHQNRIIQKIYFCYLIYQLQTRHRVCLSAFKCFNYHLVVSCNVSNQKSKLPWSPHSKLLTVKCRVNFLALMECLQKGLWKIHQKESNYCFIWLA